MRIENKTEIPITKQDLLDRRTWSIENARTIIHARIKTKNLKVKIYWLKKNAKKSYRGYFDPTKKLIVIGISKNITYPFSINIPIGTEQVKSGDISGYIYRREKVTFNSPKELIRFIFLHEFSHYIDFLKGLNLNFKQTKANRFALRHFKAKPPRGSYGGVNNNGE